MFEVNCCYLGYFNVLTGSNRTGYYCLILFMQPPVTLSTSACALKCWLRYSAVGLNLMRATLAVLLFTKISLLMLAEQFAPYYNIGSAAAVL